MKRKIFATALLIPMLFTKAYASNNILFEGILPVMSHAKTQNIYCDTKTHWCNFSATRLYEEGIFTGIKIGDNYYFGPEDYITRGEFLLYLDAVLKAPSAEDVQLPFKDAFSIPKWQISTVKAMYKKGYVNGIQENSEAYFNHDEKISRLECAIILNNILAVAPTSDEAEFYDSYLIPKNLLPAVKNVSNYGLMTGYDDNSFRPYVKITRAMLADILCRTKDHIQATQK